MLSLQTNSSIDLSQPYHIYYDINMINNDQTNGKPTNSLTYTESRNMPFLQAPSNYFCSIVRFSLQTCRPAIPVFVPHIQIGQSNINKTIYKFYLYNTALNVSYEQNVLYAPSDLTIKLPNPPTTQQDLTNEYYYMYEYQQVIEMLNNALNLLVSQHGGIDFPFFYYDVNTSLITLYIPNNYIANFWFLGCNPQMQSLVDTIPVKYSTLPLFSPAINAYTFLNNTQHSLNQTTINAVVYNKMLQESTTIGIMNPVQSIVFTTALLPVNPNLVSPPQIFNSNQNLQSNGNNSDINPIITDFEIALQNGNTYKDTIEYIPQGEYRLIDLTTDTTISSIELSVFWKDRYGQLHPYKLSSGCSCNIKIMFRRKDYNVNF